MLSVDIERATEARLRRVMFAIQAGPRTARHFGYPRPPTPPSPEVIRRNVIEGCKRDAAFPCRQCNVVHQTCDHCPLKVPTW